MKVVGLATTNPAEKLKGKVDVIIPDYSHFHYEDYLAVITEK